MPAEKKQVHGHFYSMGLTKWSMIRKFSGLPIFPPTCNGICDLIIATELSWRHHITCCYSHFLTDFHSVLYLDKVEVSLAAFQFCKGFCWFLNVSRRRWMVHCWISTCKTVKLKAAKYESRCSIEYSELSLYYHVSSVVTLHGKVDLLLNLKYNPTCREEKSRCIMQSFLSVLSQIN